MCVRANLSSITFDGKPIQSICCERDDPLISAICPRTAFKSMEHQSEIPLFSGHLCRQVQPLAIANQPLVRIQHEQPSARPRFTDRIGIAGRLVTTRKVVPRADRPNRPPRLSVDGRRLDGGHEHRERSSHGQGGNAAQQASSHVKLRGEIKQGTDKRDQPPRGSGGFAPARSASVCLSGSSGRTRFGCAGTPDRGGDLQPDDRGRSIQQQFDVCIDPPASFGGRRGQAKPEG